MKTLTAVLFLAILSIVPIRANATSTQALPSAAGDACVPPAMVASFLGFTPAQTTQFETLLGQFLPTLQALQTQIAARQAQLEIQLDQPNPNPGNIAGLVLQIHALQQQVGQAVQIYQNQFAAMLTDEQKQKVQAVTLAAQLQPVAGAFVALKLAPPPTPLPCQNQ